MDVVAHVVIRVAGFGRESDFAQRAEFPETPALVLGGVDEVDAGDGVREQVEDGEGDEGAVEAVGLVVGA